jgi:hypothetical protein
LEPTWRNWSRGSTGNINADLISGPCLSLDGFGIDLPTQGAESMKKDKSRNKAHVGGLYKLDKKGERTNQLPCHFESNKKRWTMTMVMSADKETTQRVGLALQVQRQANTPANIYLAEQKFLQNIVKSVQNQLESMQRDSRFVSVPMSEHRIRTTSRTRVCCNKYPSTRQGAITKPRAKS